MSAKIICSRAVPSKNKFIGRFWGLKDRDTKHWERDIWANCNGKVPKFKGKVRVKVTSYRFRLIDPGNLWIIGLVDALKRLEVIEDDDAEHIELPAPVQLKCDSKSARTVIELEAV